MGQDHHCQSVVLLVEQVIASKRPFCIGVASLPIHTACSLCAGALLLRLLAYRKRSRCGFRRPPKWCLACRDGPMHQRPCRMTCVGIQFEHGPSTMHHGSSFVLYLDFETTGLDLCLGRSGCFCGAAIAPQVRGAVVAVWRLPIG